jgi:hypothetical protein
MDRLLGQDRKIPVCHNLAVRSLCCNQSFAVLRPGFAVSFLYQILAATWRDAGVRHADVSAGNTCFAGHGGF